MTTSAQRDSLLRLIAAATEQNLPLVPLLESWSEDESGVQRRRVGRLAKLLRSGRPLADAVEEVPGVLRDEDLLAIRFDAQSGTRTAAMRELLAERSAAAAGAASKIRRAIVYFCVVAPLALVVIIFTQLKIVPVLHRIFVEFGVELPPVLAWSATGRGLSGAWWLAALLFVATLLWLYATRSGRRVRQAIFGRLFRPFHQWRSADVLQKIGVAAMAGRPIPAALSTLARYHFDPTIRHELLYVRNEVEQGAEVWESLQQVDILTPPEVQLLRTAERMGNQPWVLKQLVEVKQQRTARRWQRASEFLLPALVLLMALLVIFQAMTVFVPLTQLLGGVL